MWYNLEEKLFQLLPKKPLFSTSKISENDKPGYILLPLPLLLSSSTLFVLLSKWFPTIFSFVSTEDGEDNYKQGVEYISELEFKLKNAEKEKEQLVEEVKIITRQLEDSNAEKSKLEKMHNKLAEEVETSLRMSADLYNNFL